jgi:hypothetical protein
LPRCGGAFRSRRAEVEPPTRLLRSSGRSPSKTIRKTRLLVLADRVSKARGRSIGPLQVASVLLERAAELVDERELGELLVG